MLLSDVLAIGPKGDDENKRIRYLNLSVSQPNIDDCYTTSIPIHENGDEALTLFPNPNSGIFKIEISNLNPLEEIKIQIYNLDGSLIAHHSSKYRDNDGMYGRLSVGFDLSNLPKGVYVVRTRIEDKIYTHKLIII